MRIILLFLLTFLIDVAAGQSNPTAVDVVPERLQNIDDHIERYIQEGWLPGGVFMVARRGEIVYHKAFGKRNVDGPAYQKSDLFRIASMTKAVTVVAIMQLVERGMIGLDDQVSKFIPAFENTRVLDTFNEADSSYSTLDEIYTPTIRHLLTHTSGISYGVFNPGKISIIYEYHGLNQFGLSHPQMTTEEMVNAIARAPLIFKPGERYMYGLNMEVLGRVVEVVSGLSLADYFQNHIFHPLGMQDTHFYLPAEKHSRLVPIYTFDGQEGYHDMSVDEHQVFDYPKANFQNYAGGGGLSSTASDYLTFIQALLNDGEHEEFELLSRKSIEVISSDQMIRLNEDGKGFSNRPGVTYGLGFSLYDEDSEGINYKSPGTYEWGGYFNTKFFIDPKEELVFVGMTQILPFRHGDFWNRLYNVIYSCLD